MRFALAQINPTVGDLSLNFDKHLTMARRAADAGADVVVYPELSLVGYPPRDLLLKTAFIDATLATLRTLAMRTKSLGLHLIVGYPERNPCPVGRPLYNALAMLHGGEVVSRHLKTLLPTYDVFDESRYFEPGPDTDRNNVVTIAGRRVGLSICEDLWNDERLIERRLYHDNPIRRLHMAGAEVIVNASASPFVRDKQAFRERLFASQMREIGKPLVYVNQVGGNDELVFDGCSMAFDGDGTLLLRGKAFEEDLLTVDVGDANTARPTPPAATRPNGLSAVRRALVLGVRDYVRKCGFQSVVLGLSGGIDSAVTAALAVEALGRECVTGVAMPSRYSSSGSVNDARELAENLGIAFHVVPIEPMHAAYEAALAPFFAGREPDVTEENLQARVRGATLMAFSNKFGHLLLTTGNKSEIAVGYCTLYGDMCGGLAVISDLPKTDVYALAERLNHDAGRQIVPRDTITKPPSAELRPDQTDQDSLPPYDVLDDIIERYVEEEASPGEIVTDGGHDPSTVTRVIRLIDRSEYKRRQAAPGLKVTSRAFGVGRRMPIAQNFTHAPPQDEGLAHGEPGSDPR